MSEYKARTTCNKHLLTKEHQLSDTELESRLLAKKDTNHYNPKFSKYNVKKPVRFARFEMIINAMVSDAHVVCKWIFFHRVTKILRTQKLILFNLYAVCFDNIQNVQRKSNDIQKYAWNCVSHQSHLNSTWNPASTHASFTLYASKLRVLVTVRRLCFYTIKDVKNTSCQHHVQIV